jgi:hypothetical protein
MRVRAKRDGYFGHYRPKGEVFEVPDTTRPGRWLEVLVPEAAPVARKRKPKAG